MVLFFMPSGLKSLVLKEHMMYFLKCGIQRLEQQQGYDKVADAVDDIHLETGDNPGKPHAYSASDKIRNRAERAKK